MANSDKLWFDIDIRGNALQVVQNLVAQAQALGAALDEAKLNKNFVANAENLERVFDKIAVAYGRINEARSNTKDTGELARLKNMEKELKKMEKAFEKLSKNDWAMVSKGSAPFERLVQGFQLAIEQVGRYTNEINAQAAADEKEKAAESKRIDNLKAKYNELYNIRKQLQDAVLSAAPGTDISSAVGMINSLSARIGAVKRSMNGGTGLPASAFGADSDEFLRKAKEETRNLAVATDNYNKKLSSTVDLQRYLQKLSLDAESQQRIAGIRKQTNEYNALGIKIREISSLITRMNAEYQNVKAGGKPVYTREGINTELEAIQRRYNEALAAGKQREVEDAEAKNKKAAATKRATDAIQMLAHANQGLIASYNRVAEAGSKAGRINIQLQNQIAGYAGLYGIERLVKSIVTIGGQFEVQHVALQNILGDVQQANTLFSQLQALAVESPKTFMELTAYTKQLSAYQIPANELFDTTKRLADLSSGLGVDMSRLILAFGQVRSAAVLRGQELRQFTEAGIPLVQALADEFSKLNGRAVTTGEVFELISKRAVPFEMVKKILWDMTNEGGRFYNMQAELADTLYGRWQKLQDQWQISLGHIADTGSPVGSFLKGTLELVVQLTSALDKLLPMMGAIAVGKLSREMYTGGLNRVRDLTGSTAIRNMQRAKEIEANRLERERVMYGRQLSEYEMRIVNERRKLTSQDYYLLAAEKQISMQKAHQLYLEGKLKGSEYQRLLLMEKYTAEQMKQILHGNASLLRNDKSFFSRVDNALGFMGGWVGVASAAVGGIISLYSNAAEKATEARNAAKSANDAMLGDLKEINSIYSEYTKTPPSDNEKTGIAINRMIDALKNSGRYTEDLQKQVDGTEMLSDKYAILYGELRKISEEYLRMKVNVEAYLDAANRVGQGNWFTKLFNDPMSKDIKQLSESNIERRVSLRGLERISVILKTELQNTFNKSFEDISLDEALSKLDSKQLKLFSQHIYGNYANSKTGSPERNFWDSAYESLKRYISAVDDVNSRQREVERQMEGYIDNISVALEDRSKAAGLDFSNIAKWNDGDLRKMSEWINEIIDSYQVDDDTASYLRKKIIGSLPKQVVVRINALPEIKKSDLAPWQEAIDKYFKANKITIPIDSKTSLEKLEKDFQNRKKELQESIDRNGKILIKFGFDLSSLPSDIDKGLSPLAPEWRDYITKVLTDYKTAKSEDERNEKAAKTLGLSTVKEKKTGGNKTDAALKQARTQLEEAKSFLSEYKKYREVYGKEKAIPMLEELFPTTKGRGNKIVDDYKAVLLSILKNLGNLNTEERKKFGLDISKLISDTDLDRAKRVLDEQLSELQEYIQKQTASWNLYKQLLDKTGDKDFAATAFRDVRIWDDISKEFADELNTRMEEKGLNALSEQDWYMTDAAAKEHFKTVNGGYELWKKIVEQTSRNYTDALSKGADAMEKQLSIADKIKKNEEEIARLRKEGADIPGNAARIRALEKDTDKKGYEAFQQSVAYLQFFGAVLTMANSEMEETANAIKNRLIVELSRGNISARQYVKELKNVNDQLTKGRTAFKGNFMTFLSGGQKGMVELREQETANAAIAYEDAKKRRDELEKERETAEELDRQIRDSIDTEIYFAKEEEEQAKKNLENAAKALGISVKQYMILMKMSNVLDVISGVFNGLQSAASSLSEMFAALGNDDAANAFSDIADGIGAVSSVIKPVDNILKNAMSGNISGVISSAISAPVDLFTGPITAFAKLHDKSLQREIEASQQRQKEMQQLSKNIESSLNRILGGVYDFARSMNSKSFREEFNEQASRRIIFNELYEQWGDAKSRNPYTNLYRKFRGNDDTYEAFVKAAQTQEYYDMQRALLLAQQEELRIQLAAEEDKKNSDDNAISEYKQQIKELDDQIKNFALDMAKSLYDIDIHSWATELTDAIVSAWENGEDAAEAYSNKVKDLMKNLTKNILAQKVLEAEFKRINLDGLIADLMDESSGKLNYDAIGRLSEKLGEAIPNSVDIISAVLDKMEADGYIDKGNGNGSGSASSGIKSITENTADLLASYINAIRADVSVNRQTLYQIMVAVQGQSEMPVIAQAQLNELRSISANTMRNANAADNIYRILSLVVNGGEAIKVK